MLKNRLAVNLAFFLNGFIYANWVSRLPRIQESYGVDNGMLGIILLSLSLGAVVAMPFTGWFIIQNGSRRITLISLLAYTLLMPLIPFMEYVPLLILLFFITGISTGMLDVAMNAQAVMVERAYNRPIMTSFHAFFSVGMALGAWCGALFAELKYDLPGHFFPIMVLSLGGALWASRNLIRDKPDPDLQTESGPLFRIPSKGLVVIGIIAFCCMMGEGAMADWSVKYMEAIALASKTLAPIGLSAVATAATIGRIFGDRIRAMLGDTNLIIVGGILSTAGLTISLAYPEPYVVIIGFFIVGLGMSTIVPIAYSIAGNTKGIPSGVGLAMVTTVGYSGFLFGPPIIGFISDLHNLRVGLSVILVLFIIMTALGIRQRIKAVPRHEN